MKLFLTISGSFFLVISALAKPGESYALTGREKSVFAIYQADMKAYPDLYEDVDINEYYVEFKKVNDLNSGRKLNRGEKLMFPHTPKSRESEQETKADEVALRQRKARKEAKRKARQEASGQPEEVTGGDVEQEPMDNSILFGSDRRATYNTADPEEVERARAEAAQKKARYQAVNLFEQSLLPSWVENQNRVVVETGNVESLVGLAREKVDEDYAEAVTLHRYPDKNLYIFELEKPNHVGELYFFAIRMEDENLPYFYSLEKGLSFFGTGDVGILREWRYGQEYSDLGGRKYDDLAGLLNELEAGRPVKAKREES